MKREIKFRMWRDNKMQGIHTMQSKRTGTDVPVEPQNFAFSEEEILMQYTGLKDKNGKEIYEGDIIKFADEHLKVIFNSCNAPFDVEYIGGDLEPLVPIGGEWIAEQIEIIGNIYETPELLK